VAHSLGDAKDGGTERKPHARGVAEAEPLLTIEEPARALFHIHKIFLREGRDAAAEALPDLLREHPDPSEASMAAIADVRLIEASLSFAAGFKTGRKPHSLTAETRYIRSLCDAHPNENATGLWMKLRIAAQDEIEGCPFRFSHDAKGRSIVVNSNDRELKRKNFDNRVSEYRILRRKSPGSR